MKIINQAAELQPAGRKVCLAIGFFDGVHLGHQQILRQTIADARRSGALSLAVTFDRHPSTVVAPDRVPPLIYSLPQKLRVMESIGQDALLLIHFDRAFSEQTGETFIRNLSGDLGKIQSLCVGSTFTFGHKRSGNVALLSKLGAELQFAVHGMAAVSLGGKAVSSTRIRESIRAGDFDLAGQMLGRAWSLTGEVVRGDGIGRQLGFPTANLAVKGLVLPPPGVYLGHARVDDTVHRAAVNIGFRPTVAPGKPELRVEAHLLDYSGELYGKELEVTFEGKIRDEMKFASREELQSQIGRDVATVRQRFSEDS